MRFPWFLAVLALVSAACAVDKGPAACVEGLIAACDCPNGAVSRQVCVSGVFAPCECGTVAGSGGSGGIAGSAGSGGDAGFAGSAGTGGSGGFAGSAGTGGSGGFAGSAGTGGIAGSAGTGGSGGVAGSAGTGGSGGIAGSGGTGGTAGEGGTGGSGAVWSRCNVSLNNADCDEGLVCYRSTLVSSGPGVCTNECTDNTQCHQVSGAAVTATCGSEGVCRFTCAAFGAGTDCPLGMTCAAIEPFVYRCVYKD